MSASTPRMELKQCSVILEQATPQKQLALSAELRIVINEKNLLTSRTRNKVLQDLADVSSTSNDGKEHLKEQALRELLDSEVTYLKQLETILEYFMKPLQSCSLISKEDFTMLFGNIRMIYNVNGELLNELKNDITSVAGAFENLAPYFKLYAVYAYDYKSCLDILQKAQRQNREFAKFLQQQETRPEVQNKLSALLITPIQRIPRYQLLLKQIVDYSDPTDDDYCILKAALKRIEEVAQHINKLVEEHEKSENMLKLQKRLTNQKPSLIKPGRYIIKEGPLYKMALNETQCTRKYFILMNDIIVYCTIKHPETDRVNSLKCMGILPLKKCKITQILSKGCFKITCESEEIILYHESFHEGQNWVKAIIEAINKNNENRRTLKKDNSARRPVKRKHLDEYQEAGVSPGKPRKKRVVKDSVDVGETSSSSSKNTNNVVDSPCFKISGRRPIKNIPFNIKRIKPNIPSEQPKCAAETVQNGHSDDAKKQMAVANTNDVFVFGSNKNTNNGFSFSVGNIFRGIGSSVKNIFSFKK